MAKNEKLGPSFENGFICTTIDALYIIEAALQGKIPLARTRPHRSEKEELIKSGNIFIYRADKGGILRWTDNTAWSPSRTLDNFLVYRELTKPYSRKSSKKIGEKSENNRYQPYQKQSPGSLSSPISFSDRSGFPHSGNAYVKQHSGSISSTNSNLIGSNISPVESDFSSTSLSSPASFQSSLSYRSTTSYNTSPVQRQTPKSVTTPHMLSQEQNKHLLLGAFGTTEYDFKEGGLIKKTFKSVVKGESYSVVSYYTEEDVVAERLRVPYRDPFFTSLNIRQSLFCQPFRIPLTISMPIAPPQQVTTYPAPPMHRPLDQLPQPLPQLPFQRYPYTVESLHGAPFHRVPLHEEPLHAEPLHGAPTLITHQAFQNFYSEQQNHFANQIGGGSYIMAGNDFTSLEGFT